MSTVQKREQIIEKKFPGKLYAAQQIKDPSGKGKYLFWIAAQLHNGHNSSDIAATIKFFHENRDKFEIKDILKYKDLKDLEDIVKTMGLSKRQELIKGKIEGSEKIHEDDDYIIVRVDTKEAMLIYGSGTKWCVTMESANYFEDYSIHGNVFFIAFSKKDNKKLCLVRKGICGFEIFEEDDTSLDLDENPDENGFVRFNFKRSDNVKPTLKTSDVKKFLMIVLNDEHFNPLASYKEIYEDNADKYTEWFKRQNDRTRTYLFQHYPVQTSLITKDSLGDEIIKSIVTNSYFRPDQYPANVMSVFRERVYEYVTANGCENTLKNANLISEARVRQLAQDGGIEKFSVDMVIDLVKKYNLSSKHLYLHSCADIAKMVIKNSTPKELQAYLKETNGQKRTKLMASRQKMMCDVLIEKSKNKRELLLKAKF